MTAGFRRAVRTAIAGALTLFLVSPAAADFQAGLTAYQRSDYAAALREWLPVADAGNTTATAIGVAQVARSVSGQFDVLLNAAGMRAVVSPAG